MAGGLESCGHIRGSENLLLSLQFPPSISPSFMGVGQGKPVKVNMSQQPVSLLIMTHITVLASEHCLVLQFATKKVIFLLWPSSSSGTLGNHLDHLSWWDGPA